MIIDELNKKIVEAMKAGDETRTSTFKLLYSELYNFRIDHPDMSEDDELKIVKKEVKKRKDAVEVYRRGGYEDKAKKEEEELAILAEFLPPLVPDSELEELVNEAIKETGASDLKQMGLVVGRVMQRVRGNADGGRVARMVKERLNS